MTLLVLGGTAQAQQLSRVLIEAGIDLIYSIAGLVRQPDLSCPVVSGGFNQFGGMGKFIRSYSVSAIVDATHPYAVKISLNAAAAAQENHIPYWQLQRPAWQPGAEDRWFSYPGWDEIISALQNKKRPFITTGQLEQSLLHKLAAQSERLYFRTAVQPRYIIPDLVVWINKIGPFSEIDEFDFMHQQGIDVLVCKNSGGDATFAKLLAARKLGIEVFLLQRPLLPEGDVTFKDLDDCVGYVIQRYKNSMLTRV